MESPILCLRRRTDNRNVLRLETVVGLKQSRFELYRTAFATSEGALSYPLRGMLFYLYWADKAGILEDLPAY